MRIAVNKLAALVGLACTMVGFAFGQGGTKSPEGMVVPDNYVLGPEDIITVMTRDVTEASGDFMIRLDGKISFPLVGEVMASGLTTGELKTKLEQLLTKELKDPQVTINVKQMRISRVYVLGAVAKPGITDYRPGWHLSQLIASCGGLAAPPERVRGIVLRSGTSQVVELRSIFIDLKPGADLLILPGDVVNVQSDVTIRVNVIGPVAKPGTLMVFEGQGAVEALAGAGGDAQGAALSKAKIVRGGQEIPVNLFEAVKNGKVDRNVVLKDNDTLLIPTTDARVSVVGMVKTAGAQMIPDGRDWTLSQALSQAGGPSPGAKMDGIDILRKGADGKIQTIKVNYRKMKVTGDPNSSGDVVLQDRDVVFVPQSGKTESSQINAVLGLLWYPMQIFGLW
jgi:polysaccharide export outer membrane protein